MKNVFNTLKKGRSWWNVCKRVIRFHSLNESMMSINNTELSLTVTDSVYGSPCYKSRWIFLDRPLLNQTVILSLKWRLLVKILPSIFPDSCLKKQIWTFWQDPCRYNLVWRRKKCFARQDSSVLKFLSDSFFLKILVRFFVLKFLPKSFSLVFLLWFLWYEWNLRIYINHFSVLSLFIYFYYDCQRKCTKKDKHKKITFNVCIYV
jgi:hypothetical protein